MKRGGVADNETFINRIAYLTDKVSNLHHGHLINEGLVEHIFVGFPGGGDLLVLISEHLHAMRLDHVVEGRHNDRVEGLVIDHLACRAVGDAPAVEGKDVSAVGFKVQLVGQGRDAIRGTAGGQHDLHAFLLCPEQSLPRAGSHLFLTVCQRAVKVEHDHSVIHYFLLLFNSVCKVKLSYLHFCNKKAKLTLSKVLINKKAVTLHLKE